MLSETADLDESIADSITKMVLRIRTKDGSPIMALDGIGCVWSWVGLVAHRTEDCGLDPHASAYKLGNGVTITCLF